MTSSLEQARLATLRRFGRVGDGVLSKATPIIQTSSGPQARLWPSSALGKLLVVRRETSVMVVTDGISDPWDRELHGSVPSWRYGFEMAVEAPLDALEDSSDEGVARSWLPTVLWAATDWVMLERYDVKTKLAKMGALTHAIPTVAGLEALESDNGFIGGLLGIPFVGPDYVAAEVVLAHDPSDDSGVWLLPLKILTPEEYAWARVVEDSSRARALIDAFLRDPSRHASWPTRPSLTHIRAPSA